MSGPEGSSNKHCIVCAVGIFCPEHSTIVPYSVGENRRFFCFFGKDEFDDFGVIPLAGFARYYFQTEGVFVGADFGYGFLTNVDNSGGLYINPQIGYHNKKWNIYGYYQNTFAEDIAIRSLGVGVTYNIMFK